MYYSAYEILKNSINKNEFKDCIMGKGKYRYEDKDNSGPVDENLILKGIYELHIKEPKLAINAVFEKTILEMLEGNVEEIYLAIYYMFEQVGNEYEKLAPFTIDIDRIFKKTTESLRAKRLELENINALERLNIKGNIMKKVIRINDFSFAEYGRKIFDL
ncbi:hypothetical protein [Clostridium sp. HBUAS56017]|uniref:hypothetical protein n=1 Tax=Clostridium sp. HBUAS56017 TaxID=2571128 RepID=UPI0011785994|nr:hypothetical protein [Clostridium sp. HBUAS56017]